MRLLFLFQTFLMYTVVCLGQTKCALDIQEITLKDSVVIREIQLVIKAEENSPDSLSFFRKKLGYVSMYVSEQNNGDTLLRYYIAPSMYSIKGKDKDDIYPLYYTYVSGRLVLIYLDALKKITDCPYTTKSKRAIRKKVDKFLEPTKKVTFYDMNNHPVFKDNHFRIDYFKFHAGKTVYILKDQPPIIIENKDLR